MTPARLLSIFLGVAVVVVGVRIALRLSGWFGALLVGLGLSLSPLLVEHSLKVTPDAFLALFSALALSRILDVQRRGRLRDYLWSAVWIALGAASKYTPVLLVPCLLGAHLARNWEGGRWRSLLDRRLLLAGTVSVATFVAASPFTVLNVATSLRDIPAQYQHVLAGGHFGHELARPGYLFYLLDVLPAALGWPALALGLSGLAVAACRQRGAWLIVLLCFGCFYGGLGALRALNSAYILPAVLPVALGLAGLATEASRLPWAHRPRVSAALGFALLVLVSVPPAIGTVRQHERLSRPSTKREAKAFIVEELNRPDAYFACELGGPRFPPSAEVEFSHRPFFARLDASQRQRLLSQPFVNRFEIAMYMTDASGADLYYDLRHYLNYDYIVVSGLVRQRYEGLAGDYPRQNEFYSDLERYCELVRYFPESPDRFGPDIWIYAIDDGTKRILVDRGPLRPGFQAGHLEKVRREDLRRFLVYTATLAARREDWATADLYLTTTLELWPNMRGQLLVTVAHAKYKAGDLTGAAELCAEALRNRPDDPMALVLRAAIVEEATANERKP
jgi:hypothetical protein